MKTFTLACSFLLCSQSAIASSVTREEAIAFLQSTLSLPDKTDYSEDFYLRNVDASLKARQEMPWGEIVPDKEFLHFVLPVRVNNESLDDSRTVFYEELKGRVKDLSMEEAILEVNHWCHEKVTYKPSDARTSSPLSAVSQAIGRCGEESTFTVAALRAVGIPARQIYTPRWAHTDDNHAWVEAWADGKWHFIGACEPEPVADLAWFNEPAARGILMNTNVVGNYSGPEEVLLKMPLSTRINTTANYAPVATLPVLVKYPDGSPAPDATVNFCIYNYSEYYPAVSKKADAYGQTSLTAGLGDMLVWASDGSRFGFAIGNPKDFKDSGTPLAVTLSFDGNSSGSFNFDITPPSAATIPPSVTPAQRLENDRRLHAEDSIRNAYTATFASPQDAEALADKLGVDKSSLVKILTESRGNHAMIASILKEMDMTERDMAVRLLLNVSEKDRRDIPAEVIADVVENLETTGNEDNFFDKYILNPRIEYEFLTPWRGLLKSHFSQQASEFRNNPELLAQWVSENIADASSENPQKLRMSPGAVLKSGKADPVSRDIFFVAAARSLGIPARIDPVTASTQYSSGNEVWTDVSFAKSDNATSTSAPKGKLQLTFNPQDHIIDPKYNSQFSISKITDGIPQLLEFEELGAFSSIFAEPYELEAGQYILTSGQRLADGSVLARSDIFSIKEGETTAKELVIRQDNSALSVIGSLNAENIYHDLASDTDKSLLSTTGRGYYVLGLISPNHEPSAHSLNDISSVAAQLENSGVKIMILFDDKEKASRFNNSHFPNLPANVVFGIDNNSTSRNEIVESLHLDNPGYPLFVIADTFNRIVWSSSGYSIGTGETLLNVLSRLE